MRKLNTINETINIRLITYSNLLNKTIKVHAETGETEPLL